MNIIIHQPTGRSGWRLILLALGAILGLLAGAPRACGQEALRLSLAEDTAAAKQQRADNTLGYYNLLLGPTTWRFSAGLTTAYNDNVRLEPNGEGDLLVQPSLNTQIHWPVTDKNSLNLTLSVGYSEYLQHSDLSQIFIRPGSGLAFDIYVGDFKINLHDRVNISENAYQNAGNSGNNENLISLENTIGVGTAWNLNHALVNFGYDHVNYLTLSQPQQQPDAASENIYANAGVRVRPELLIGVEAGGTLINYQALNQSNTLAPPNATQWYAGAYGSVQISDHISTRLDAGYTVYTPENTTSNLVTSDTSGPYFAFSLSHHVNQFFDYTLSAGRSSDLAAYGQAQSYYYVRLDPNLRLLKNYTLTTPLWWQQGTRIYNTATSMVDYEQYGLGFRLDHQLMEKLTAGVAYQFIRQTSSVASFNYTVNIVSLNFTWQF